jgi:large subunit ribosomal protein L35
MPKLKSHSSFKKRIKITGSGKLLRRHAAFSHLRSKDRKIRKYVKKKDISLSSPDRKRIKRLILVH